MRLPWEQLAMEVIEVSAPELGANLYPDLEPDLGEAAAGWGIVHLVKWALARCPEHLPPSASALIPGPTAAKQICRAARWRGAPLEYVRALIALPDPVIEQQPDGIRMRGLDRYDAAWGDRHPKEWAEWRAAHPEKYPPKPSRKSAGNPPEPRPTPGGDPTYSRPPTPDPDPDADRDVDKDPEEKPPPPTDVEVNNLEETLWASIQWRREHDDPSRRLAPEKKRPRDFRDWVQRAMAEGFSPHELEHAHCAYLLDEDFRLKGWPTAIFITEGVWRHRARIPPKLRAL